MQYLRLGFGALQGRHLIPHEVDAGRQYRAVVGQLTLLGELDAALLRVDADHVVVNDAHAPLFQTFITDSDVGQRFLAGHDEVGNRAGNEFGVAFDQCYFNTAVAPHAQIFGGRGAAVAAANDDHMTGRLAGIVCAPGAAAEGNDPGSAGSLEKVATIEHVCLLISSARQGNPQ